MRVRSALRALLGRKRVEGELDDELRAYVELLAAEKMKNGLSPSDAHRAALIEVGGMERVKDDVRDERPGMIVENGLRDLRIGLRLLRRSPGFATVAILTIALGIGATTAIFSVIDAVALKPLPYPTPDRLVYITSTFPRLNFDKFWISPPEYFELRERSSSYADIAAYRTSAANVGGDNGRPERVPAIFVTANMFDVLGTRLALGTTFTAQQDLPNGPPAVVLSDVLWRRVYGGDRGIIGKQVLISGLQRTVMGVAPPGLDLHDSKTQLWLPLQLNPTERVQQRGSHYLYLVGRLKPGIPFQQASAELAMNVKRWGTLNPNTHAPNDSTHRLQMTSLRDEVIGNVSNALWILQGAVLLVLLIACANVANLLLVRAEARHKEFAVRSALGAANSRLLRQFVAEGLVLTVIGAGLGVLLAQWGLKALLAANPNSIPRAAEIGINGPVLLVATVVAVLTALIFGAAPLLHLGKGAVAEVIKEGGTRSTPTAARHRVRRVLVAAEIALAVMLVVGAGLLVRSFDNLTAVDAGFAPDHLITFGVVLPGSVYQQPEQRSSFILGLQQKLKAIPGVTAVTAMTGLPPQRDVNANDTEFEGMIGGAPGVPPLNVDYYQTVTTGYFETMGIHIVKGRGFVPSDAVGGPVAVVNESLVKVFYPKEDPIGKRIRVCCDSPKNPVPWMTIVGVAKDVKQGGLDQKVGTELYFDLDQAAALKQFVPSQYNLVLRTNQPVTSVSTAIFGAVRSMDAALPVVQMRTMDAVFADSVSRQRFLSQLLTIFAAVALLLAAIGTYGVVSYLVTERQREIGIRVALGAGNGNIVELVLKQGLMLAGLGIAIGVGGALLLSRLTKALLFGVSPSDPFIYIGVAGVIALVALAACLVPARRAMAVDPLEAIRGE